MTKDLTLTSTVSEMRECTDSLHMAGSHFLILEQISVFIPRNWQLSLSLSAASSFRRPEAACAGAYECAFQGLKTQITHGVLVPWGSLVKLQPEVLSR